MASNDEWVVLPQTTSDGLPEFQNIQFAPFDRHIFNADWRLNMAFVGSGNHEDRTIGFTGYPSSIYTLFKTGPSLDYDYLVDNLLYSTSVDNNTVDLYSVEYPDSRQAGVSVQPDRLVVKANRGAEQMNKKIGTLSAYGTYIDVHLTVWRRRYSGGTYTDTRIGSRSYGCRVYRSNTNDVTQVETRLEFFYVNPMFMLGFFKNTLLLDDEAMENLEDYLLILGMTSTALVPSLATYYDSYTLWFPEKTYFENYLTGDPMGDGYDPIYGDEGTRGGYDENPGTHDFSSDNIGRSLPPSTSVLSPGFINAYKVSTSLLSRLGSALFPQNVLSMDATGLSETQALLKGFRYLIDTQYNKDALDFVISCHILPVNVPTGSSAHISVGGKDLIDPATNTYYSALTVSSAYVTKSCGSVTIPEAFGNFLDYTVKCKLYLPFYGYVDIPPEYWNGGTIAVEYMFNIIDGTFVAFVTGRASHSKLNSLIGQYSGVAVTHIPLRGADYSTIVAGIVSTTAGLAGTVASGGNPMVGGAVASSLGSMIGCKPNLVSNGSANSSSAMMMRKTPYLIIEYPTPQFSKQYPNEKGLPLNVTGSLGQFGGMTIAENPVLNGIPCTEREKERIRNALKTGLIF